MRSDDDPIQTALNAMTTLETPRVWSLLVTIFGDLAQDREDRIDGPLLTRITEEIGIKPEAVRVALHRLRNDDWITSVKVGRTASHALTDHGRTQSRKASTLIYARPADLPQDWHMILTEGSDPTLREKLAASGYVQAAPRVMLAAGSGNAAPNMALLSGQVAPDWLKAQLTGTDLTDQFAELLERLYVVSASLKAVPAPKPLDVAVLRCLIVHHWRRLALRQPYLPPALTGEDWPGHICRQQITRLLTRLQRPSLANLQAE